MERVQEKSKGEYKQKCVAKHDQKGLQFAQFVSLHEAMQFPDSQPSAPDPGWNFGTQWFTELYSWQHLGNLKKYWLNAWAPSHRDFNEQGPG